MAIKYLDAKRIRGRSAYNQDAFGTAANATNSNVTLDTSNEKLGSGCLDFNGTNAKLSIPAQANLVEGLTEWSVSFWVWADAWSGVTDKYIMAQWDTSGSDGAVWQIEPQSNQRINVRVRKDDNQATSYAGGTACNGDGTWNHIVFNFYVDSGQKAQLYINGVADSAGVVSFPNDMRANADDTALSIGTKSSDYFSGKFDDIGFWSRKLTTAEITALYNGGTGAAISTLTDTSGLRVYYDCESATVNNNAVATDEKATLVTTGKENWTEMDSSKVTINNSTGKIDFALTTGSAHNIYYPITVADDTWQLRAIVNFTAGANANVGVGNQKMRFGFATLGTADGEGFPTEGIIATFQDHGESSANERWYCNGTGGSNTYTGTDTGTTSGVDYYLTLKRTSTTAISLDLKTVSYSGSSLTGFPLTTSVASGTDNLAYLYFTGSHTDLRSNTSPADPPLSGTIRAIQVWQTTAGTGDPDFEPTFLASSDLPANTLFEETDTYSTFWLQSNKWYPLPSRGVIFGDGSGNSIDYINPASAGNATQFQSDNGISENFDGAGAGGNSTYAVCGGTAAGNMPRLSFWTLGSSVDWADMERARKDTNGCSNDTKFVLGGGYASSTWNTYMSSSTMDTSGNSSDFGDLSVRRYGTFAFSSDTRCVFAGGYNGALSGVTTQEFVTFASGGTCSTSGSLIGSTNWMSDGCSNSTIGLWAGGYDTSNQIQKQTIASLGTSTDWGDLTVGRHKLGSLATEDRAVFTGGGVIDYKSFATDANATDFGDLNFSNPAASASDLVRT